MDFSLRVKKTIHRVETHWLSGKKKVLGATVSKEGHANSLLGHERTNHLVSLKKGATINSASYCQLLRQNSPYLLLLVGFLGFIAYQPL